MPLKTNTRSRFGQLIPNITEVAGSTYTVTHLDAGSIITNRGGGALTVTLPEPSAAFKGFEVRFFQVAAGDLVIGTAAGEKMVEFNNATADSILLGTNGEEIGNGVRCVCDGTSWLVFLHLSAEAVTTTVTDA